MTPKMDSAEQDSGRKDATRSRMLRYGFVALLSVYGLWQFRSFQVSQLEHMDFRDALHIVEEHVSIDANGRVFCLGRVRNESQRAWEDVLLEIQFLDADGQLVDIVHDTSGFYVPPSSETSFRIQGNLGRPAETSARHVVAVRSAR